MQRRISYPIVALVLFLFFWVNLPQKLTDRLRHFAISSFHSNEIKGDEIAQLKIENQKLKSQITTVYDSLLFDRKIGEDLAHFNELKDLPFAKNKKTILSNLIESEISSIPSKVIFRDPSSWSSTLWVNVGRAHNELLGKEIIHKNSPVLSEGALVGVIDQVEERQSRVRLITDSGLTPAVRVLRGATQNRELIHQIQMVLNQIEVREDLFNSILEKEHYKSSFKELMKKIGDDWEDGYLAKGEIRGSSRPFWRSRSPILKGIGFNYEYGDEEGPSRELQSDIPILKTGDLLVTSGLDGVFPTGIKVGTVIHKEPLKQGSYYYEIKVRPCVSNLNDLETLFILPPVD